MNALIQLISLIALVGWVHALPAPATYPTEVQAEALSDTPQPARVLNDNIITGEDAAQVEALAGGPQPAWVLNDNIITDEDTVKVEALADGPQPAWVLDDNIITDAVAY